MAHRKPLKKALKTILGDEVYTAMAKGSIDEVRMLKIAIMKHFMEYSEHGQFKYEAFVLRFYQKQLDQYGAITEDLDEDE